MAAHSALQKIVGESAAICAIRDRILEEGRRPAPALIQGPTGSGKELVAEALHAVSERQGSLVAVNVCAISPALFESMFFGHVRGAFTGAVSNSAGYLAEADRGTLFMDEIGAFPLELQVKLLRVLETGQFRPVGAARDRTSDFRVLAASNEPIVDLVRSGRFRQDLAYRLAGMVIEVPPLCARREDIRMLAQYFADNACDHGRTVRFTAGALRMLERHDWPGNVRELRNVVEQAAAISGGRTIGSSSIRLWPVGVLASDVPHDHEVIERRGLIDALERHDWQVREVAHRFSVHWTTIYRRIRQLGIELPRRTRGRPFGVALSDMPSPRSNGAFPAIPDLSNGERHARSR